MDEAAEKWKRVAEAYRQLAAESGRALRVERARRIAAETALAWYIDKQIIFGPWARTKD